jgi:F0F1-type ATP synthase assembly protein I
MRKTFCALTIAAATAMAAPAMAQGYQSQVYPGAGYDRGTATAAELGAGVVAGTVVGLGISEGWWTTAFGAALPTTAAGAAVLGGVAGIGTVATIDALVQPCAGFQALFDLNHGRCVNGQYVGYSAQPVGYAPAPHYAAQPVRHHSRHTYRHRYPG